MILEEAKKQAKKINLNVIILGDSLEGESRESAKVHVGIARQIQRYSQPIKTPALILSGGETSVTLKGDHKGGPNTEFILSMLNELKGQKGIYCLACDSDGIDGSGDNAGAWISPDSYKKAISMKMEPEKYLSRNNSYEFFKKINSLLITGPTLTNINDFRAIYIES